MPEPATTVEAIAAAYDRQSEQYTEFAGNSFSWHFIERPGFDRYISDFYVPETRALDLGCGDGRVMDHLVSCGIDEANLTGVEISGELLALARTRLPKAKLVCTPATNLPFVEGSFDLATANMLLCYLDRDAAREMFEQVYRVLGEAGRLFIVDADPDKHLGRNQQAGTWLTVETPWGSTMPHFCHDFPELLLDDTYFAGFDYEAGWQLTVDSKARLVDPGQYAKYTEGSYRLAVRLKKVSPEEKERRLEVATQFLPSLRDAAA